MQHTFYAVFPDAAHAAAAMQELEQKGTPREHFNVILHKDALDAEALQLSESDVRRGAVAGGLATGAVGALFGGLVLGPIGLVGAGIAFGALAGGLVGAAMGGMAGASSPDPRLEKLIDELKGGRVVAVVEAPGLTLEEEAQAVMGRNGAQIVNRPLV